MIIGICGHKRHGKDSIADVLVKLYGYDKRSLADPMKEACMVIFGWSWEHVYGELKDVIDPAWGISPRQALQTIGTEWGQYSLQQFPQFKETTGRGLWVKSLMTTITGNTAIADVRFPHEVDTIREKGGKIIMVRRPGYPVDLTHESESAIELIQPDYVIRNGGTLDDLEEYVIEAMEEII